MHSHTSIWWLISQSTINQIFSLFLDQVWELLIKTRLFKIWEIIRVFRLMKIYLYYIFISSYSIFVNQSIYHVIVQIGECLWLLSGFWFWSWELATVTYCAAVQILSLVCWIICYFGFYFLWLVLICLSFSVCNFGFLLNLLFYMT